MKKFCAFCLVAVMVLGAVSSAYAMESNATYGDVSGKTVLAGICSFLLWPGIGQYINDCQTDKNWTHAVIGLFPLFRFWSGWDAVVERQGGYWKGRI